MILSSAKQNKYYEILQIDEKEGVKAKLLSMGVYTSAIVKILKNDKFGPIIILIKNCRLSLGRGLAKKIIIKEYEK